MTSTASGGTVEITVVESPACHLCEDARKVVERLSAEYPITLRVVDIRSARGQALIAEHRPAMSPLVLIDGAFLCAGRLPRGKLLAILRAGSPLPRAAV